MKNPNGKVDEGGYMHDERERMRERERERDTTLKETKGMLLNTINVLWEGFVLNLLK